ncbi:hypothetical protein [Xanthomonas sacchari]|uniref:hypothetical protein n=1 Tax=Xanthomonas sacchari TaxID=56458 RepID=UPI00058233CA|nr:hypothetical protein [Xanthomonas sacchari]AJC47858.1 hypothetical protein SB85_18900 [Xanthomonas sacchari]
MDKNVRVLCLMLSSTLLPIAKAMADPPTELMQPLPASLIFNDDNGKILGTSGPQQPTAYALAQWGANPNSSDTLQPVIGGSAQGWQAESVRARVKYYPVYAGHANAYELAQADNKCAGSDPGNPNPYDGEKDLFLVTADSRFWGSNALLGFTPSAPLSSLGAIRVRVGLSRTYEDDVRCGGTAPSGTGYAFSFILGNTQGQTLFYQIDLGHTGATPAQDPSTPWCPHGYEDTQSLDFCLDDDIRNMGGKWNLAGTATSNDVDFLPRLLQVIGKGHTKPVRDKQGNPINLDRDPSHWTLTSVYMGHITQGKTISTTIWYDPSVKTWPGGTFCSAAGTLTQYTCNMSAQDANQLGAGWVAVGNACYHRNAGTSCPP